MPILSENRYVFWSFFLFGLLNNVLYVIILSAAIDLVGAATPKAIVLLSDVFPALVIKVCAPFFIHVIPYKIRLCLLLGLSSSGMFIISLSKKNVWLKILGICFASFSSGLGESTFLQLSHYYPRQYSVGGFSAGTGGAGLFGSFFFMLLTNIYAMKVSNVLLICSVLPMGFLLTYFTMLPYSNFNDVSYSSLDTGEIVIPNSSPSSGCSILKRFKSHIVETVKEIKPLIGPYMLPLSSVYMSEYIINQGVSPTLLFDLNTLPSWLFSSYRDIYVVYGFLYQLGVFVSRSSINFGIRISKLKLLSALQFLNLLLVIFQSVFNLPFPNVWSLMPLIFYEGLLGGLSYVNTFISVSEDIPVSKREFSMGCVTMSDTLGIVLAGCINFWLETQLCQLQVRAGRDWCRQ